MFFFLACVTTFDHVVNQNQFALVKFYTNQIKICVSFCLEPKNNEIKTSKSLCVSHLNRPVFLWLSIKSTLLIKHTVVNNAKRVESNSRLLLLILSREIHGIFRRRRKSKAHRAGEKQRRLHTVFTIWKVYISNMSSSKTPC